MKINARNAAIEALLEVKENEGYSNIVIDKVLRKYELEKRDSALATTIFYGVLEKKLLLDFYLSHCYSNPDRKLDVVAEVILQAAAFQILFLDRVPDSAAINEAVNSIKDFGKQALSGFVNAVLRKLVRSKEDINVPEDDSVKSLSVRYSVPTDLISMWKNAYGLKNTVKILQSFNEQAKTYIRVNSTLISQEELKENLALNDADMESLEFPPDAAILSISGSPTELPAFTSGMFHVQDLSAQIICDILAPQEGETVIDTCSAPGGKAFTIAEKMKNKGKVYALDLYKGRVNLIKKGAERLKLDIVEAQRNDALKGFESFPLADKVICDVPCSGFGTIRRKPEIRYKELATIESLKAIQYEILRKALEVTKPKGVIMYSTCTLNPEENQSVVERFLNENNNVEPLAIPELPSIKRVVDEPNYMLTMMPFAGASDGFFVATFKKTGE